MPCLFFTGEGSGEPWLVAANTKLQRKTTKEIQLAAGAWSSGSRALPWNLSRLALCAPGPGHARFLSLHTPLPLLCDVMAWSYFLPQ